MRPHPQLSPSAAARLRGQCQTNPSTAGKPLEQLVQIKYVPWSSGDGVDGLQLLGPATFRDTAGHFQRHGSASRGMSSCQSRKGQIVHLLALEIQHAHNLVADHQRMATSDLVGSTLSRYVDLLVTSGATPAA